MDTSSTSPAPPESASRRRLWLAVGAIVLLVVILLVGKFGGFFDPEELGIWLGQEIRTFADGPLGVPALVLTFCVCAFIAVPQFVLIGIAVFAFGPALGSLYAWIATMCSGSLTYGIGRVSGDSVLSRASSKRLDAFRDFIGRNAFIASAVVRNVPMGPFLFVNMVFGALRARFSHFLGGMAVGIIPKIAVVGFAGKGIRAAVEGNPVLAVSMVIAATAIFAWGIWYVRQRRAKGENIALLANQPVDSSDPAQHE